MKRARRHPNPPHSLGELGRFLEDPQNERFIKTSDGTDQVYAATVGPRGHQSNIYLSRRMKRVLRKSKEVFVDATFTPTPQTPEGCQVLQIVTLRRGSNVCSSM